RRCSLVCCCVCCGSCRSFDNLGSNPTSSGPALSIARVHPLDGATDDFRSNRVHARIVILFNLSAIRGLCSPQSLHLRLVSMVGLEGLIQSSLDRVAQGHQVFTPKALEERHTQKVFQLRPQRLVVMLLTDSGNAVLEFGALVALESLLIFQEGCAICVELLTLGGNHSILGLFVGVIQLFVPSAQVVRDCLGCCYCLSRIGIVQCLLQPSKRIRYVHQL